MMQELSIDIMAPVVENKQIRIDGANSVVFHNAGAQTVLVDNHLTIAPGSTFQFSTPTAAQIIAQRFRIAFTGSGAKRLEIATMRPVGEVFSNLPKSDA